MATSSLITTLIYTVTGTGANGCKSDFEAKVKVNSCAGINELKSNIDAKIKIYPNPNSGNFILEAESEIQLTILNELGQLVKTLSLNEQNNYRVNESGLSNGIYFVMGRSNFGTTRQKVSVLK